MGVYGTTYKSAFSGLGKPSIKLEFEDNEELLAFQRRIDGGADGEEQGGAAYDPELANYDQKRLDEAVANHNTIGWGMSDELRDGWTRLHSDAAPKGYDVMIKGTRPALRLGTYGWEFQSSTDAQLVPKEKGLKAHKGGELEGAATDEETEKRNFYLWITSRPERIKPQNFGSQLLRNDFGKPQKGVFSINTPLGTAFIHISKIYGKDKHILRHIGDYFNVLKRTLEDPFCVFASYDDHGHPCNIYAKCFDFEGQKIVTIVSPINPATFDVKTAYEPNNEFNHLWNLYKKGGRSVLYPQTSIKETNNLNGLKDVQTSFKIVEFRLPITITENGAKSCVSEAKSLGKPGDVYMVTDMRTRSRKEPGELLANKNLNFKAVPTEHIYNFNKELYELTKDIEYSYDYNKKLKDTDFMRVYVVYNKDTGKCIIPILIYNPYKLRHDLERPTFDGSAMSIDVEADFNKVINFAYYINSRGYAEKYGYGYITNEYYNELFNVALRMRIDEYKRLINKNINKKENEKYLKYFILFYSNLDKYNALDNGYNQKRDYFKAAKLPESLGRAGASDALYNNNDIIDTRGLKPTYKILQSYDAFFAPAQHSQTFAGVGLDSTKKLIADICKAHYKDCARIAQHLKGDTKLQSVFNLWHWLRHNIRYEYDREGREEVRTPLRTWADRNRGVDCDCLSVFAWCVLKCMGYDPAFELVCFKGKKQPSHILVNLDGIRCDRVWFVFNALPPGVTNSEIYRLTDRATAAQLAGLFN